MRALRLHGAKDVRVEDVPVPTINEKELLIKVISCSICGSDFRNAAFGSSGHGIDLPITMGHELVGTIEKVGRDWESSFSAGETLLVGAIIPCGICSLCVEGHPNQCLNKQTLGHQTNGAFAEYMRVPEQLIRSGNVIKIEAQERIRDLALSEPLSCAINGQEISQIKLGDSVLIVGCGPLGLFHIQLALLNGAKKVIAIDFDVYRLSIAKTLGADYIFSPKDVDVTEQVMQVTQNLGVDVVMIAVPVPSILQDALKWVKNRGRINVFGGMPKSNKEIMVDLNEIHYREITIQGTSDSTPRQLKKAMELISSKRIKAEFMISKVVGLDEASEILRNGPQLEHIKFLVDPTK